MTIIEMPTMQKNVSKQPFVTILDIGTSKITCIIAKIGHSNNWPGMRGARHQIHVLGVGYKRAHGIKAGNIMDIELAEQSIRATVAAAENEANVRVSEVIVNVSGGRARSDIYDIEMQIAAEQVTEMDMHNVVQEGVRQSHQLDRAILHTVPVAFSMDGNRGITDPRGMFGDVLGVDMHVVSADVGPLRNLKLCIEKCHLKIQDFVVSAYASGLSCLVEDEMELGVTCIDMGAGSTSIAVFFEGKFIYTDMIAIGGQNVTIDLARGLNTQIAHAERAKIMHGSAIASAADDSELISIPMLGEEDWEQQDIEKSILTGIIEPRIEEIFEIIRDRLEASGYGDVAGHRVVLTGGASQLTGVREIAARILGRQVRNGKPLRIAGLNSDYSDTSFATATGLLAYAGSRPLAVSIANAEQEQKIAANSGYFSRMGNWLKNNF
ncbi:MAG: cell division protein FtsA [Rhizobiales bacterium]|nr:cell division protein FtsA [Hyphomicrobiales bacterium]